MPVATVEEIKARIDLVELISPHVVLKQHGKDHKGLCPFHAERTPSFTVHPERGCWRCFGCGRGGDCFDFLMEREGLTFVEAAKKLAGQLGAEWKKPRWEDRIVATYDYRNEQGELLFQAVRLAHPKEFKQRQPDDSKPGGWDWSIQGVRRVLYQLPEVLAAVAQQKVIFSPEGEKDCDNLRALGLTATTNAGGAGRGKWDASPVEILAGAHVVVLPDHDGPPENGKEGYVGQAFAQEKARSLSQLAASVRVLDLSLHWPEMPLKGDVSDWLAAGHTREQLLALAKGCPVWTEGQWIRPTPVPAANGHVAAQENGHANGHAEFTDFDRTILAGLIARHQEGKFWQPEVIGALRTARDREPLLFGSAWETCRKLGVPLRQLKDALSAGGSGQNGKTRQRDPEAGPDDSEEELRLTDLGNGERLIRAYGQNLHFFMEKDCWLEWSGACWQEDERFGIYHKAKEVIRSIYQEAAQAPTAEDRERIAKHAFQSEAGERVNQMVTLAKRCGPNIAIRASDMDLDPWLLNCLSGTIDLRNGSVKPHDRLDLITQVCPTFYDPDAECPVFEEFLRVSMDDDQEMITYLQRVMGFCLTGVPADRVMWFFHGSGGNGKSTFLDILEEILAGYAKKTPADTLMMKPHGDGIPNDLAQLHSARFVSSQEQAEGQRINESRLKDLTGRDTISARFLRKEFFQFKPKFKLIMYGNHRPQIRGRDDGIWDRMKLVPWTVQIPDEQKDPHLPAKLRLEMAGILAYAVRGCLRWQELGSLEHPEKVKFATGEYRKEQDPLSDFITDCFVHEEDTWSKNSDVWATYEWWCKTNGEKHPLGRKGFTQQLLERGYQSDNDTTKGGRIWWGFRLVETRSSYNGYEPD